jgi:hypothetical protein
VHLIESLLFVRRRIANPNPNPNHWARHARHLALGSCHETIIETLVKLSTLQLPHQGIIRDDKDRAIIKITHNSTSGGWCDVHAHSEISAKLPDVGGSTDKAK